MACSIRRVTSHDRPQPVVAKRSRILRATRRRMNNDRKSCLPINRGDVMEPCPRLKSRIWRARLDSCHDETRLLVAWRSWYCNRLLIPSRSSPPSCFPLSNTLSLLRLATASFITLSIHWHPQACAAYGHPYIHTYTIYQPKHQSHQASTTDLRHPANIYLPTLPDRNPLSSPVLSAPYRRKPRPATSSS